jgi:hypothetical protein
MTLDKDQIKEIQEIVSTTIVDTSKKIAQFGDPKQLQKSLDEVDALIKQNQNLKNSEENIARFKSMKNELELAIDQHSSALKNLEDSLATDNDIVMDVLNRLKESGELTKETKLLMLELEKRKEIAQLEDSVREMVEKMEDSKFFNFLRNPIKYTAKTMGTFIGTAFSNHIAKSPTLKWMTAGKDRFAKTAFAQGLVKLNEKMGIGRKAMGHFFKGSGTGKFLGLVMKPFSKMFSGVLTKFFPFKNIVDFLLSPAGILAMITIFSLFKNFVWPILKPVWEWIKGAIENVKLGFTKVMDFLKPIGNWLSEMLKPVIEWINSTMMPWFTDTVMPWFKDTLFPWIDGTVKPLFKKMYDGVRKIYSKVFDLASKIYEFFGKMMNGLSEVKIATRKPFSFLGPIGDVYLGLAQGLKSAGEFLDPDEVQTGSAPSVKPSSDNKKVQESGEKPLTTEQLKEVTSPIKSVDILNALNTTNLVDKASVTNNSIKAMTDMSVAKTVAEKNYETKLEQTQQQKETDKIELKQQLEQVQASVVEAANVTNTNITNNKTTGVSISVPETRMDEPMPGRGGFSVAGGYATA